LLARFQGRGPGICRAQGLSEGRRRSGLRVGRASAGVAHHRLDLVERNILAGDRQKRRVLREIDRIDGGFNLGRDRDRLAVGVLGGDGDRVVATRPEGAVVAATVPDELLVARIDGVGAGNRRAGRLR
jgi:hypothetical protein